MRFFEQEHTKTLTIKNNNYEKNFCISDVCSGNDDRL